MIAQTLKLYKELVQQPKPVPASLWVKGQPVSLDLYMSQISQHSKDVTCVMHQQQSEKSPADYLAVVLICQQQA